MFSAGLIIAEGTKFFARHWLRWAVLVDTRRRWPAGGPTPPPRCPRAGGRTSVEMFRCSGECRNRTSTRACCGSVPRRSRPAAQPSLYDDVHRFTWQRAPAAARDVRVLVAQFFRNGGLNVLAGAKLSTAFQAGRCERVTLPGSVPAGWRETAALNDPLRGNPAEPGPAAARGDRADSGAGCGPGPPARFPPSILNQREPTIQTRPPRYGEAAERTLDVPRRGGPARDRTRRERHELLSEPAPMSPRSWQAGFSLPSSSRTIIAASGLTAWTGTARIESGDADLTAYGSRHRQPGPAGAVRR